MEKYKYTVCTRCMTYNHAPYIVDAMQGFCMQETTFPVVYCILDDASTDGEQEVIQKYLLGHFNMNDSSVVRHEETDDYHAIFAQHKTNKNCFFAVYFLKYNHFSIKKDKRPYYAEWVNSAKYIAYCEGDDYWTSPQKLQKQVEFLESHPEYVFCCHRFKIYDQNKHSFRKEYGFASYKENEHLEISEELFLNTWITQILTSIFRKDAYNRAMDTCIAYYNTGRDTFLYYELLKLGKGISLNQYMGIYRWHDGGIAIGLNQAAKYKNGINLYTSIYKHHPEDKLLLPKIRYNYDELLRYATISREGHALYKESLLYCETLSQKMRMLMMYIIHPKLFIIPNKIFKYYLRRKCSISNP